MAGYDLIEGFYESRNVSEDELWSVFSCLFSPQTTMVSSYKYGFLKSIIDNLYNVDDKLTLTFDQLFSKFGEVYWNLVVKHKLAQQSKKTTKLEQVLYQVVTDFNILETEETPYECLPHKAMEFISVNVKLNCKRYVVGALFADTKQLFYSFSRSGEWLKINPIMYAFLCKHKMAIEKLNYYEWAKFLERVNKSDEVDHLLTKLDTSAKRNNLSYYRDILFKEFENKCFYCGKKLDKNTDKVAVDHFIPWSFIKDDQLWNFVLACPTCNSKKSDKLANPIFLQNLVERNNQLIIGHNHEIELKNYQENKLQNIYNWAKSNGYSEIWTPEAKRMVL